MEPATFDRLAARTRLQSRALRLAHAVLVEGISGEEAARREGVVGQTARDAANRILRELRLEGGYPQGWRAITIVVPPEVGDEIRELARAARRREGLEV